MKRYVGMYLIVVVMLLLLSCGGGGGGGGGSSDPQRIKNVIVSKTAVKNSMSKMPAAFYDISSTFCYTVTYTEDNKIDVVSAHSGAIDGTITQTWVYSYNDTGDAIGKIKSIVVNFTNKPTEYLEYIYFYKEGKVDKIEYHEKNTSGVDYLRSMYLFTYNTSETIIERKETETSADFLMKATFTYVEDNVISTVFVDKMTSTPNIITTTSAYTYTGSSIKDILVEQTSSNAPVYGKYVYVYNEDGLVDNIAKYTGTVVAPTTPDANVPNIYYDYEMEVGIDSTGNWFEQFRIDVDPLLLAK